MSDQLLIPDPMDCIIGDPDNFRGSVGSGIRSSAPASHPLLCTGGSGGKRFTLKAQALHLIPDPMLNANF